MPREVMDSGAMVRGTYVQDAAGLALLLILVISCFVILQPFLAATLWAAILALSTWPLFVKLKRLLNGRQTLAATIMTLAVAAVFLLPLIVLGSSMADGVVRLAEGARQLLDRGTPPPPSWVAGLPLVGQDLNRTWQEMAQDGGSLAAALKPYVATIRDWILRQSAALAGGFFEVLLSVVTAFFLYRHGAAMVRTLDTIFARIAGNRSRRLIDIAGATITGVVHGILGTALAQAILAAAGFWVAGVPAAFFLGVLAFVLSLVPFGLVLVWVPAVIWLAGQGQQEWAIFLAVWNFFVVGMIDNFLKPYLISRAGDLPLILIFFGVLGGVMAFGLIGLFIGPTLLAVGYSLVQEWGAADAPEHRVSPYLE